MYMSCADSRNLIRKSDFSTADGLHTSFEGSIDILGKVFCSDDAWFNLNGYGNSQNSRILSAENPSMRYPLHSLKIAVWCAIS
jgi:hypothetical protein